MKCGFIGLGSQGAPMARRMIEAGLDVTLWARRAEALAPFADTQAKTAANIAELGALADHVGVCVFDDAGVIDVCSALIEAMRPGSRIAIHSTTHPDTSVRVAETAAARDIIVLDAPVSGGEPMAKIGALTVMAGGDRAAFEAAKPVFETFGKVIVHLGDVGAGQRAKLVNNALMAAHMTVAHYALQAGAALDIDRAALIELIKASSGRSFGFETYARLPSPEVFAHGWALLDKDVGLLSELLRGDPSIAPIRDLAAPFLKSVQNKPA
jgi:3-hydroxyisobutyrate dehydrogenase